MDAMVVYFHRSNERGNGEDRLVGFGSAGLSGCGGSGPGSGPGEGNKEAGINNHSMLFMVKDLPENQWEMLFRYGYALLVYRTLMAGNW